MVASAETEIAALHSAARVVVAAAEILLVPVAPVATEARQLPAVVVGVAVSTLAERGAMAVEGECA